MLGSHWRLRVAAGCDQRRVVTCSASKALGAYAPPHPASQDLPLYAKEACPMHKAAFGCWSKLPQTYTVTRTGQVRSCR